MIRQRCRAPSAALSEFQSSAYQMGQTSTPSNPKPSMPCRPVVGLLSSGPSAVVSQQQGGACSAASENSTVQSGSIFDADSSLSGTSVSSAPPQQPARFTPTQHAASTLALASPLRTSPVLRAPAILTTTLSSSTSVAYEMQPEPQHAEPDELQCTVGDALDALESVTRGLHFTHSVHHSSVCLAAPTESCYWLCQGGSRARFLEND
ncbi:unnamed protein product [Gongylonema pulchrum]|uniref:Uncharacterized protein n=1 Tax=Gongylonema pulchrum TaxID=637853 RepID=A0A183DJJ1_9BILA|nr:unnamed protein product [Gongylonema pulchrum]